MRTLLTVLVVASLAGCVDGLGASRLSDAAANDAPVVLPDTDFYQVDGEPTSTRYLGLYPGAQPFHPFHEVEARIEGWAADHARLVEVRTIGTSLGGLPLWDVVVTDRSVSGPKPALLFDGGHHGNEIAGVEMALYFIDFLLANAAHNATVAQWLRDVEVHTVPIVNPDGYVAQTRGNALGVNLNRNYDIDWGNPLGASNGVMGTLAHATNTSMPSVMVVAENCGPHAFSEPESIAMRDLMAELGTRMVSYFTYHTPTNALVAPWSAYNAPFPVPDEHEAVFQNVLRWTQDNTEYRAGKAAWGDLSAGLPYSASGSSQDYAYATHLVPAFTLEVEIYYTSVTSTRYAERVYVEPYQGLEYWLHASLPIPLYLLANWDLLDAWQEPTRAPPLPEGIPPAPVPAAVKEGLLSPDEHHHEGAPEDPGALLGLRAPRFAV